MGRPVFSLKETDRSEDGFIGFSAPLKYAVKSHNGNLFRSFDMANVLFVLLETCKVNTGLKQHNFIFSKCRCLKPSPKYVTKRENYLIPKRYISYLFVCLFVLLFYVHGKHLRS